MVKLDEYVRVSTNDGHSWICKARYFDEKDYPADQYPGAVFEHAPEATGLELAQLIDEELESANFHSLCGFAGEIHTIVESAANKNAADKVLEIMWSDGTLQNLY